MKRRRILSDSDLALARRRRAAGRSQAEIAAELGVSIRTVRRALQGEPRGLSAELVAAVATAARAGAAQRRIAAELGVTRRCVRRVLHLLSEAATAAR